MLKLKLAARSKNGITLDNFMSLGNSPADNIWFIITVRGLTFTILINLTNLLKTKL